MQKYIDHLLCIIFFCYIHVWYHIELEEKKIPHIKTYEGDTLLINENIKLYFIDFLGGGGVKNILFASELLSYLYCAC